MADTMNHATVTERGSWIERLCRNAVLARLELVEQGELVVRDPWEERRFGRRTDLCDFTATVTVHDGDLYPAMALGGAVGAGEAYMRGGWNADDLTRVVRIFAANPILMANSRRGVARLRGLTLKLFHRLHENSKRGSRRNIAAHYDLGNKLFELFLDPEMMYSSAVFERPDMGLDEAAVAKLDRVCRKLALTADDHLLEIGSGWGGMAIHAARHYGCRVTTTTVSREQHDYARRRVAQAGLDHLITVLDQDYRDLTGSYDKLVSIEMIEAVGHSHHAEYFRRCTDLLKPDGMMLLQTITIAEQDHDQARDNVDFIKRYIFPGGSLPSISGIAGMIKQHSDMQLFHVEDFGPHYARTLALWRQRFMDQLPRVRSLGYSDSFIRKWDFYLSYCEGGFEERCLGVAQILLTKPQARPAPLLAI
jgi:cyclopropane-fatty-acyl-phospholipid synthase